MVGRDGGVCRANKLTAFVAFRRQRKEKEGFKETTLIYTSNKFPSPSACAWVNELLPPARAHLVCSRIGGWLIFTFSDIFLAES